MQPLWVTVVLCCEVPCSVSSLVRRARIMVLLWTLLQMLCVVLLHGRQASVCSRQMLGCVAAVLSEIHGCFAHCLAGRIAADLLLLLVCCVLLLLLICRVLLLMHLSSTRHRRLSETPGKPSEMCRFTTRRRCKIHTCKPHSGLLSIAARSVA